jgi:hypothetical protein
MFKKIFVQRKDCKEMIKRLPAVKLLTVTDAELKQIMAL